jgi:hypothetical protein
MVHTKIGTTIAKSLSGCGRDKRRKKIATPVFCKPLKKISNKEELELLTTGEPHTLM